MPKLKHAMFCTLITLSMGIINEMKKVRKEENRRKTGLMNKKETEQKNTWWGIEKIKRSEKN